MSNDLNQCNFIGRLKLKKGWNGLMFPHLENLLKFASSI